MAIGALHILVRKHQGELGPCVVGYAKRRRLPAIYRVAALAATSVRPLQELPVVHILVTIHAVRKRYLRLEVPVFMALQATHRPVLAQQRELRLRVIE
jgi:hypothetical protein